MGKNDGWGHKEVGLAKSLSLGRGFLEPAGPQSQRTTLQDDHV